MSPSDAEITELPSSPGARLRRERESRGLTEQQAAEALNLDPSVVSILETNDFAALGAPVFVKGHLRRYAGLLELDEAEIVGAYERSKQHIAEPTLVPKSRLEMAPVRGRSRWPWVVGGTAAFLLAAALLAYLSEHGLPWTQESAEQAPEAQPGTLANETVPSAAVPAPAGQSRPVEAGGEAAATPATPPATAGEASPGTKSGASAPAVAPASGAASVAATATQPPGPGQVSLQLRFRADAWVEIFDGSGKAVVYDLGKAGTERTVTARAPLSVTLGNASAVAIAINGRAVPPPPAPGAIARFSVGADGTLH